MLTVILFSLFFAALFAMIAGAAEFFFKTNNEGAMAVTVITFIICAVFNFIGFYFLFSEVNTLFWGTHFWVAVVNWVVVVAVLFLATDEYENAHPFVPVLAIGLVVFAVLLIAAAVSHSPTVGCAVERGDKLASLVQIVTEDTEDNDVIFPAVFPGTDDTAILHLDPDMALKKVRTAMGSNAAIGSYLAPHRANLVQVDGGYFYVVDLMVSNARGNPFVQNYLPTQYFLVDATDPYAEVRPMTGFDLQYVPDARYQQDLERHVSQNWLLRPGNFGSRTIEFEHLGHMQVDDEFNPYYGAPIFEYEVGYVGKKVVGYLLVNPVTGEIEEYDLDEVPEWVDRVYPLDLMKQYLSWWGEYAQNDACNGEGDRNKRKVDQGNDVIMDFGVGYQISMTSVSSSDQSQTERFIVDPRTGIAYLYAVHENTPTVGEIDDIVDSASSKQSDYNDLFSSAGYEPKECHERLPYETQVWTCILASRGNDGDNSNRFAGIALIQNRYIEVENKTILAANMEDALRMLRDQLIDDAQSSGTENSAVTEALGEVQIRGTISHKSDLVVNEGSFYYYFVMQPADQSAPILFRLSAESTVAGFTNEGDEVTLTAFEDNLAHEFEANTLTNHTLSLPE